MNVRELIAYIMDIGLDLDDQIMVHVPNSGTDKNIGTASNITHIEWDSNYGNMIMSEASTKKEKAKKGMIKFELEIDRKILDGMRNIMEKETEIPFDEISYNQIIIEALWSYAPKLKLPERKHTIKQITEIKTRR